MHPPAYPHAPLLPRSPRTLPPTPRHAEPPLPPSACSALPVLRAPAERGWPLCSKQWSPASAAPGSGGRGWGTSGWVGGQRWSAWHTATPPDHPSHASQHPPLMHLLGVGPQGGGPQQPSRLPQQRQPLAVPGGEPQQRAQHLKVCVLGGGGGGAVVPARVCVHGRRATPQQRLERGDGPWGQQQWLPAPVCTVTTTLPHPPTGATAAQSSGVWVARRASAPASAARATSPCCCCWCSCSCCCAWESSPPPPGSSPRPCAACAASRKWWAPKVGSARAADSAASCPGASPASQVSVKSCSRGGAWAWVIGRGMQHVASARPFPPPPPTPTPTPTPTHSPAAAGTPRPWRPPHPPMPQQHQQPQLRRPPRPQVPPHLRPGTRAAPPPPRAPPPRSCAPAAAVLGGGGAGR